MWCCFVIATVFVLSEFAFVVVKFFAVKLKLGAGIMRRMSTPKHSSLFHLGQPRRAHEAGAALIMTVGFMFLGLMCMALVVDTGRLYMEKRKLQRIADIAAMDTAFEHLCGQLLGDVAATGAARNSAAKNGGSATEVSAKCGHINLETEGGASVRKFSTTKPSSQVAVEVVVKQTVPASLLAGGFLLNKTVSLLASAVATEAEPVAAFQIGSRLLQLDGKAPLGKLLKAVGLNVENLKVLDSAGLATATITPAGLLKALGLGVGIDDLSLLDAKGLASIPAVTLGRLLEVSADVVTDSAVKLELGLLEQDLLAANLKDIPIRIFPDEDGKGGLLTLATDGVAGAALDVGIGLGDLLTTALAIGTGSHGLQLGSEQTPGLNLVGVTVKLGIVEPPSIGIGPVGTTAYNAQVRLYIDIDTNNLLGPLSPLIKFLLDTVLGVRVHLPIFIDLVNSYGTLEDVDCKERTADVKVESDVLQMCIGEAGSLQPWTTRNICGQLQSTSLVKLLHLHVLSTPSGGLVIDALAMNETISDVRVGEAVATNRNELALGTTVKNIVNELLSLIETGLLRPPSQAEDKVAAAVAKTYLTDNLKGGNGKYKIDDVISAVKNGGGDNGNLPLDVWDTTVNRGCFLGLGRCETSGTSWNMFKGTSNGDAEFYFGGFPKVNGYSLNNCSFWIGSDSNSVKKYNECVESNLAAFLTTKPGGVVLPEGSGIELDSNGKIKANTCSGVLCTILKPLLDILTPVLNGVGKLLELLLGDVLGLELGVSDVKVLSVECGTGQLVI